MALASLAIIAPAQGTKKPAMAKKPAAVKKAAVAKKPAAKKAVVAKKSTKPAGKMVSKKKK